MKLIITDNHTRTARLVADRMAQVVAHDSQALLGLATGSSPEPVYAYMLEDVRAGRIDYSSVRVANLDEYVGLGADHEQSYYAFMRHHLFDGAGIGPQQVTIPDGLADPTAELARLNTWAASNTIDLQLLGVGSNGHVGFNEPQSLFHYGYHMVELTQQTRSDNARMFCCIDEVPTHAITMGIGDIMQARAVVLIASGANKREAIRAILETDEITPHCPCSVLKFHQNCTIYIDRELAQGIKPGRHVEVVED